MSYSGQLVADRYRLTSLIGSGGMGRVWLARDEVLHRDVAVKEVMLPEDMTIEERAELYQRTMREARAGGRLSHPNVVAVYDVLQDEGRPWIVMELIRSRSLYDVVKQDGPLPPRRVAQIGLAVLSALRTAHHAGVYHRDVKPGNVLLGDDGRVVLTDFGLATFEGDGTVTRSGVILGSAQYISPERARDGVSGPESDLWSLGATLYAAVEGRSPFARETPMATLTALATQPPDPPRHAGPLRQVLIGLLRKNPRQRMKAAEVERLLAKVAAGDNRGRRAPGPVPAPGASNAVASTPASSPVPAAVAPARLAPGPLAPGPLAPGPRATAAGVGVDPARPAETVHRRRIGPWVAAAAVAVAIGVAASLYLHGAPPSGPTAGANASTSTRPTATAAALTAAMGVQACANQIPAKETPVRAAPGSNNALDYWTPYVDPDGFGLNVPIGWGESRIGDLVCFRDPNSLKTIAVYDNGRPAGDPLALVDDTSAWQTAASLTGYRRITVQDMHLPEGGAMLEYTYQRRDTTMHGQNWMLRLNGRVFTVFVLASDSAWSVDRDFLVAACATFHLVTPE